jgi:hypothetical protein
MVPATLSDQPPERDDATVPPRPKGAPLMASAPTGTTSRSQTRDGYSDVDQGGGWLLFAGIMIVMVGVLNVIYGIAAIDDANFFVANQKYILSDLNTWGWVMLVVGALQILAAFSIWNGGSFGRWVGIGLASLNAIAALLSIPAYPFWSLAVFTIDILIIYGLATHGGASRRSAY